MMDQSQIVNDLALIEIARTLVGKKINNVKAVLKETYVD